MNFSTPSTFIDTSYSARSNDQTDAELKKKITSLSSDQYFGRDEERRKQSSQQHAGRISQFSGATSISSAQFFDREEGTSGDAPDFSSGDLSAIGTSVVTSVKKVTFFYKTHFFNSTNTLSADI